MNYSKIRKSDLRFLVESSKCGTYRFNGKTIREVYCDDGVWYKYDDDWRNKNCFRTLLQAVKAYKKIFG